MSNRCISCGSEKVEPLIEMGLQPPSNRYVETKTEDCESHPLTFGFCPDCGLAQLIRPMPPEMVRSHYEWITYNEPEGHLDDLVEVLGDELGHSGLASIIGVTYKDDSTLQRFNKKGLTNTYRLKESEDLGIHNPLASLETIQAALSPSVAEELAAHRGRADIVLVRHILEHAHQPRAFLEACRKLCKDNGLMVFEVPDCRKILDGHDHCFLWEEHISYFTPETLRGFLEESGLKNLEIKVYPYPMEDSLVAIVRNANSEPSAAKIDIAGETSRLRDFASAFAARGKKITRHLRALQMQNKRVALFGAGHLAAKFINFYGLSPYLHGVIDDNPNKLGRLMPGSKLPIISSGCLESEHVDLCLLTLNPESEQKVLKAKAAYLSGGGKFRSIFSASSNSIDLDIPNDPA